MMVILSGEDVVGTHRMLLSWRRGEEVKDACVRTFDVLSSRHAHDVTDVRL